MKLLTFLPLIAVAIAVPTASSAGGYVQADTASLQNDLIPHFAPGTCKFRAEIGQHCPKVMASSGHTQLNTTILIREIVDTKGEVIVAPNNGNSFNIDIIPYVIGVPGDFGKLYISWNDTAYGGRLHPDGVVSYSYNGCGWLPDGERSDCGQCNWRYWSAQKPDCGADGRAHRSTYMDCEFRCGVADT